MIEAIDAEGLVADMELREFGQEEEVGDLETGDVIKAAEEGEEGGEPAAEEGEELDLGLEGLGDIEGAEGIEGIEGLGEEGAPEETFGLEGETEEGEEGEEEEEEELLAADINKDAYADYTISENKGVNDSYGFEAEKEEKDKSKGGKLDENASDNMDDIVSDLRNLFEAENPFAAGGPLAKEKKTEGDGMVSEKDEDEEDDEEETGGGEDKKDLPGKIENLPPALQKQALKKVEAAKNKDEKIKNEGAEDIKNKNVINGDEGISAAEGAPSDMMPKNLGGKIPGGNKVTEGGDGPGNEGSDDDCKEIGGDNPIKRDPKNDNDSNVMKESKFSKGPFRKVK